MENFESIQAILEEAGLYHRQDLDLARMEENGSIILNDSPLADRNYNDIIDAEDVAVFVDGERAELAGVDDENGVVRLMKKPENFENIRVKYAYSSVNKEFVKKVRGEVIAELESVLDADLMSEHEEEVRWIVRIYSAGKLLIRDYGFNQDFENGSKDGYKKIELAKTRIEELRKANSAKTESGEVESVAELDLFEKPPKPLNYERGF